MNPFVRKLLALVSAAAILISIIPAVHADEAESETSVQLTSVEVSVPGVSPDEPLTRRNLCGMVMDVYKSLTGQTEADWGQFQWVFVDSCDPNVHNAYALNLVTAEHNGFFYPSKTVSRQDFFTSASKLLDAIGYVYDDENEVDLTVYSDADELMDYAVQPTQVLLYIGALEDADSLEPNLEITAGEAAAILDRVVTFYCDWQADPVAPRCDLGKQIADLAVTKVGCRYVSGGHGPKKFDCSGLVYWTYKQYGYDLKPGARNQWSMLGSTIKTSDLRPGDLLFFSKNGKASGIFHVGIYIGDGEFVHAANSRKGVIITDMDDAWYSSRYLGAKRAIN